VAFIVQLEQLNVSNEHVNVKQLPLHYRPQLKDRAENPMLLVDDTRREIEAAIDQFQTPETFESKRDVESIFRPADKVAVARVVNIDPTVAEVAHPKLSADYFESPRCVEISVRDQAPK